VLVTIMNGSYGDWVFTAGRYDGLENGIVGVSGLQRRCAKYELDQDVRVESFRPAANIALASITLEVDLMKKTAGIKPLEVDCIELAEALKQDFSGQVFATTQLIAFKHAATKVRWTRLVEKNCRVVL
jgi:hypothetical protein